MTIGIIGAMELEVNLLQKELQNSEKIERYGFSFYSGTIGNHKVIVLLSGIGKVSASVGTSLLISMFSPDLIINTGVAGGLKNSKVYDIIIASEVKHHDVDVTDFGYALGQQAQMPEQFLPNEIWVERALKNCQKYSDAVYKGMVVSGDQFINNPNKKAWIETHFPQALAVEMEAAAIAQTCYIMKIPFLLIRAISDTANEGNVVSYETFVEKAGALSAQMNINLIKNS